MWVWPSIGLGLLYPALAASARRDIELLERLPEPRVQALAGRREAYSWALVGAAIVLAVAFGLIRVGISDVYTESLLFMALALVLGMASPAAALLMIVLFVTFDVLVTAQRELLDPLVPATAGRAISWWLLWLLAVAIPLMARALPGATLAAGQPRDPVLRRAAAYAAGAVTTAVLLLMWVGALPFLIRPVFTWNRWYGVPTADAVQPVQASGIVLVALGVVLALAVTAFRDAFGALDREAIELSEPSDLGGLEDEPLLSDQGEFAARIITHVFAVVALGGLVSSILGEGLFDIALLFGALVLARPVTTRGLARTPIPLMLVRIPWVVRFLGGFVVAYVIGLVVTGALDQMRPTEFFPVVVSAAIALFVLQILIELDTTAEEMLASREAATGPPTAPPPSGAPAPGGVTAAAIVVAPMLAALLLVITPSGASADNCSGGRSGDCPNTAEAQAGAAAGSAGIVAVSAGLAAVGIGAAARDSRQRRMRRRRRRVERPDAASPAAATADPAGSDGTPPAAMAAPPDATSAQAPIVPPRARAPGPPAAPRGVGAVRPLARRLRERALRNYYR